MNSLPVEQKLIINLKVAQDMWPDCDIDDLSDCDNDDADIIVHGKTLHATLFNIFDPEKGDLSKAVEFYKLSTEWKWGAKWWECKNMVYPSNQIFARHELMQIAQQQAVIVASSRAIQTKEDK